ncbi:MAG: hypothetical protein LBT14_01540 [Treponema sp.]|jgi:hypothetical protein|nr:hypothetical protein [Treponema sp.]
MFTLQKPLGNTRSNLLFKAEPRVLGYNADSGTTPTLGELKTSELVRGETYDYFECLLFGSETEIPNPSGGKNRVGGGYEIRLSLRQPSAKITISGVIENENRQTLYEFKLPPYTNTAYVSAMDFFTADDSIDKDKLILSVKAEYAETPSASAQSTDAAVPSPLTKTITQTVQISYENSEQFTYSHNHPVKRENYDTNIPDDRIYGKPIEGSGGGSFEPDADHILIALVRKPSDLKDIDYLCGYGYKDGVDWGYPRLGLPGEGTVTFTAGGNIVAKDSSAVCLLYAKGGGVTVENYSTDDGTVANPGSIINLNVINNVVHYTMPSNRTAVDEFWKINGNQTIYDQPAAWQPKEYDYVMQLTLRIEATSGQLMDYVVVITSAPEDVHFSAASVFRDPRLKTLRIVYGCVAKGTGVLSRRGEVSVEIPIEELRIGDRVFSPQYKCFVKITNTWTGIEKGEVVEISGEGFNVLLTGRHPVLTPKGFIKASDLKDGDIVLDLQGEGKPIKINRVPYDGEVFNLDTEDGGGFIAGGIAVGTNSLQNEI